MRVLIFSGKVVGEDEKFSVNFVIEYTVNVILSGTPEFILPRNIILYI